MKSKMYISSSYCPKASVRNSIHKQKNNILFVDILPWNNEETKQVLNRQRKEITNRFNKME